MDVSASPDSFDCVPDIGLQRASTNIQPFGCRELPVVPGASLPFRGDNQPATFRDPTTGGRICRERLAEPGTGDWNPAS
jgi:hypothetical protein